MFRPRREATERLERDDALRKKLVDADVSREMYREKMEQKELEKENAADTAEKGALVA